MINNEDLKRAKNCAEDRKTSGYICAGCQYQHVCGIFDKTCPTCGKEHLAYQDFRDCFEGRDLSANLKERRK